MGSRGSEDKEWQALKKDVFKRDRGVCRLCRILTAQEMTLLQWNAGSRIKIIDPAHVLGVGPHPEVKYELQNVVSLNRYSHDMLDTFKDPITGKRIDKETHTMWWKRIIGGIEYQDLLNLSKEKRSISSLEQPENP